VAVMRGKLEAAAVLLASATPSLESYQNAKSGKYALLELPDRVEQRPLPNVEVVDMREEYRETGAERALSRTLVEDLKQCFARGEQAMVLLNRRGYAPVVLCRTCGETVQCRNCAVSLTQHKREQRLECHYCGHKQPVPKACPKCGSEYVYFIGTGTERLQELLQQEFPQARIARLDRDIVRSHRDFERVLSAFHGGDYDLLVGTQMIAKGHDVHGVTLVGVVGADFALGFPDFRAAERTFNLLTQVAGRAGRGNAPGKVVFQSYFPEHYSIQFAATHDFPAFFEKESKYRKWMHYPPFASLANVLVRAEELGDAMRWAGELGRWFEKHKDERVRVLGPAAAPLVRLKREYRYHFVVKSESRERMNGLLRGMLAHAAGQKIPRTNVVVDVDAVSLL
jgi:primosomal protein N' (replication factor Y)